MFPSKKEIADYLGLDRTTVSKILNNYDRDKFSHETIERVEAAARELGYAKSQRRLHPRRALACEAEIDVVLKDSNRLVSHGKVAVKDVSLSGMLLDLVDLEGQAMPATPFYFDVSIRSGNLTGLSTRCRPVRFAAADGGSRIGLGVEFESLPDDARANLTKFLSLC